MNKKMYTAIAAGLLMLTVGYQDADATPIDLNGYGAITKAGQSFSFTEEALPQIGVGQEATFSIWARGDFSPTNTSEYLAWDMEGLTALGGPNNGGFVTNRRDLSFDTGDSGNQTEEYNQVSWNQSWTIDYNTISSILDNGILSLNIDLTDNVDIIHFDTGRMVEGSNHGDFLMWELSYENKSAPVPEPATMLLMATGLIGLGALKRKKTI